MKTNQYTARSLAVTMVLAMTTMILTSVPAEAAEKKGKGKANSKAAPEVLFVQNAKSLTYDKDSGVLTLVGTGPVVTWFSDRPVRAAGHIVTPSFVKIWDEGKDSFKADPPNANLSIIGKGTVTNAVVELQNPTLKGRNISYKVKVLEGDIPASGGTCSLFIDGILAPANTAGGGLVKGAATGALIGAISGNAGRGAAIGAGVGLLRGAINQSQSQ